VRAAMAACARQADDKAAERCGYGDKCLNANLADWGVGDFVPGQQQRIQRCSAIDTEGNVCRRPFHSMCVQDNHGTCEEETQDVLVPLYGVCALPGCPWHDNPMGEVLKSPVLHRLSTQGSPDRAASSAGLTPSLLPLPIPHVGPRVGDNAPEESQSPILKLGRFARAEEDRPAGAQANKDDVIVVDKSIAPSTKVYS